MGQINNLGQGNGDDFERRLRALENATNQNNMAIGRGGLTVHDGGMITIENGGLRVTGSAEIIGRLFASGLVNFVGEVIISGPLDVSGSVDVSGIMTVLNDLEIASGGLFKAGGIELRPDGSAKFGSLEISAAGKITSGTAVINPDGSVKFGQFNIDTTGNVTTEGKIKAGGLTIDPDLLGGSVQFEGGGYLSGTTDGPQITGPAGNAFVFARNALAGIQAAAIRLVGAVTIQGGLKITNPGTASGAQPNVHIDDDGNLRKIT
ncbi:hypothetical protein ASF72_10605 [Arthrobacter sp. Leaf141]|uniref:hypothetical protein n=1 Tax=Arthrobacter sp. Leaf141 TaxID=1736273 RepID=UPI0006F236E6|nr:hypothetical protein [Arthrobacter sp. Leaf141]KQR02476.1 hypothetical protein ASF72_10605 [Arthrobacter sp. Leaf141]